MTTIWTPDTCGCHPPCEIELDDNGEPVKHNKVCASHAKHQMNHHHVAQECRDKEHRRVQHANKHKVEVEATWAEFDPETRDHKIVHQDDKGQRTETQHRKMQG